ncbi:NlpC/P60 family protein [Thermoanaerobacterium sp. RBIITD]|uniref:C40 family peptidase n=1 Tax=Thermoanaerobacterium sp. RBIITD TaxID=1550240 RepID=UPI000BBF5E0C|nr:NlpC/P60 family protein [Thermoanaerobacterium sp. RBIITD]SNX54710.1 Cell wall-associated hydrolase, NlpC family [Thermoanaerobacterium sp. RBIITD]
MNLLNHKKLVASVVISITLMQSPSVFAMEVLKYGSRGQAVYNLQEQLNRLGFSTGGIDGIFGSATKNAVMSLQRKYGLAVDGIVGAATEAAIQRAAGSGSATSRGSYERTSNYDIVSIAKQYLGTPYVYGGTTPSGFDCSGFVQYVYKKAGKSIGRTTYDQYDGGRAVSLSNLQPGDIVFFSTSGNGPTHEGIYIGDNRIIHMSDSRKQAAYDDFSGWFRQYYIGARRYY